VNVAEYSGDTRKGKRNLRENCVSAGLFGNRGSVTITRRNAPLLGLHETVSSTRSGCQLHTNADVPRDRRRGSHLNGGVVVQLTHLRLRPAVSGQGRFAGCQSSVAVRR